MRVSADLHYPKGIKEVFSRDDSALLMGYALSFRILWLIVNYSDDPRNGHSRRRHVSRNTMKTIFHPHQQNGYYVLDKYLTFIWGDFVTLFQWKESLYPRRRR